jgi:solute carrier family 45 protein 1/2/4
VRAAGIQSNTGRYDLLSHNKFLTSLTSKQCSNAAIALAVVSFYVLDFALNALQASLRNLLLDITPSEQLSAGNAWHSRMTQAGNIVGYGFGFLPLASLPIIRLLGGDQFRKFCIIVIFLLVITVWITCHTQAEEERILQRAPEGYEIFASEIHQVLDNL